MTTHVQAFGRENALLCAACRVDDDPQAIATEALDWGYLVSAADRQGVAPLLYDWLTRQPKTRVAEAVSESLYSRYWTNHFRNRRLGAEFDRVSQATAAAGINLMPLKGAALIADYYPRPALRPMSDIDCLVQPHQLTSMERVLRELGYAEATPLASYVEERWLDDVSRERQWTTATCGLSVLVEFRAEPLEPAVGRLTDLDPAYTHRLRQHAESIWARGHIEWDGAPFRFTMSREDLLLHVVTHMAAKHSDFRLIWLHDVARILTPGPRAVDWDYVCATASQLRLVGPMRAGLEAAARLVGARVPFNELKPLLEVSAPRGSLIRQWEFRQLSRRAATLLDRDLRTSGPGVWPPGAALGRLDGWGPRMRALRWLVSPSRDFMMDRVVRNQ